MFCYAAAFLAILATSFAQTTVTTSVTSGLQNSWATLTNALRAGIGIANSTVQLGSQLTSQGVDGAVGVGQMITNSVAGFKSTALQGGSDILKQVANAGSQLGSMIPGMSIASSVGGNVIKTAAGVGNMIGQKTISATQGLVNGKLALMNGVAQGGAAIASAGANLGAGMALQGLYLGDSIVSGVLGSTKTVNGAAQTVSRVASTATISMSPASLSSTANTSGSSASPDTTV